MKMKKNKPVHLVHFKTHTSLEKIKLLDTIICIYYVQ